MAVLKFSLLRLGVFAAVFLLTFQMLGGLLAAVVGLIVSFAIGYLFFSQLRVAAGEQAASWMGKKRRTSTEAAENAAEDELAERFHEEQEEGPR
ncbi:DUF4229 domain-containing protein [Nesterenkonia alba]|uniref:DUF4229 domain-containing protein n=1 Tax=Nesterenkonia alba TaxID=515814 RepID=UPI0003B6FD87|nr:DUF4229 domain-containing protein [Nesterenkonia alba]